MSNNTDIAEDDDVGRLLWAFDVMDKAHACLLRAQNQTDLFNGICQAAASEDKFPLVWVGIPSNNDYMSINCAAKAGTAVHKLDEGYDDIRVCEQFMRVSLKSGIVQHVSTSDDPPSLYAGQMARQGFKSAISIPIRSVETGDIIAAFMLCSSHTDAFREKEIGLFMRLSEDIGYGLENLTMRIAHGQILMDSIEALASTLELRDPYTAGHQMRVSKIATAIAERMRLPSYQIKGIQVAAVVHDIGKMRVPADLLTKPSRLSDLEYRLVQEHSKAGYDILSKIQFPWPIAEAVYQHHEKMNGSGYPRGLRGANIIMEARIITVADIVESITSHRPYRAALGLECAIQEITKLAGVQLDADVVEACKQVMADGYTVFA